MSRLMVPLVALLPIAAAGWLVLAPDEEAPSGVAIVFGDSLLFGADDQHSVTERGAQLAATFAEEGYEATLAGYEDQTIPDAHANVWPDVPNMDEVEVLVIAIGTNDAHVIDGKARVPLPTSRHALRLWLYQTAETVPCVVLVEVNEHATAWGLDQTGPRFNEMLREATVVHPNAFTVEWAPEYDNLFIDEAGREAYRRTIAQSLARC